MNTLQEKYELLKNHLRKLESVAVAYSGGVDSTLLLHTAKEVLGEHAVAVTASSASFPLREQKEAGEYCRSRGILQIVVETDAMQEEGFRENPVNRCYICKKAIFTALWEAARSAGMKALAEGSNLDDLQDYRPGLLAVKELGVVSPLRTAGLTKAEIRTLSRQLQLPTWKKPSYACLASRFVYGEPITQEKLKMVDHAEQLLRDRGFTQLRVRIHGTMARIELLPEEIKRFFSEDLSQTVSAELRQLGFSYVTLDLEGYRAGSMNEGIDTSIIYESII